MKKRTMAVTALLFFLPMLGSLAASDYSPWVVVYSDTAPAAAFEEYKLIVFDGDRHPSLDALSEKGKVLLGYLSLGEVQRGRAYYGSLNREGLLLSENKNWKGAFHIDIRRREWPKRVIEKLIPALLHRGFDGLFLDTLDSSIGLEREHPSKFKGMKQAAIDLVKGIRLHFPYIPVMINRGYGILEEVAPFVDMVLGESVSTDFDFDRKRYRPVEPSLYRYQVGLLQRIKRAHPSVGIYTLDYWNGEDSKEIAAIYKRQRENGFIPYVSTIELNTILKEPK
ncbi:MAG: endo alpha-1,4 polygalactosaminidase [Proteobacteria bacterium]|nr:endo alpha-1,4 polygalactosaminidase [Pseudomonadota bacterium]